MFCNYLNSVQYKCPHSLAHSPLLKLCKQFVPNEYGLMLSCLLIFPDIFHIFVHCSLFLVGN